MNYIVFDLEFNQNYPAPDDTMPELPKNLFEIIQIGAVKLDSNFQTAAAFNRYVKPTAFPEINTFVSELTGITDEKLSTEKCFPDVYNAFAAFIQSDDTVFCVWGLTDIRELFKNAGLHQLDTSLLPKKFINIQPYASKYLRMSAKKLLRLETVIESLDIPKTYGFHNALHDAYYTAEVFKKIYNPSILPAFYDSSRLSGRNAARKAKEEIDFDALLKQFEKMYARELTEDERDIIKLAYKMGRTRQFIKKELT